MSLTNNFHIYQDWFSSIKPRWKILCKISFTHTHTMTGTAALTLTPHQHTGSTHSKSRDAAKKQVKHMKKAAQKVAAETKNESKKGREREHEPTATTSQSVLKTRLKFESKSESSCLLWLKLCREQKKRVTTGEKNKERDVERECA